MADMLKSTRNEEIQNKCIAVNTAFKYGAENGCLWLSDKRRFWQPRCSINVEVIFLNLKHYMVNT